MQPTRPGIGGRPTFMCHKSRPPSNLLPRLAPISLFPCCHLCLLLSLSFSPPPFLEACLCLVAECKRTICQIFDIHVPIIYHTVLVQKLPSFHNILPAIHSYFLGRASVHLPNFGDIQTFAETDVLTGGWRWKQDELGEERKWRGEDVTVFHSCSTLRVRRKAAAEHWFDREILFLSKKRGLTYEAVFQGQGRQDGRYE